MNLIIKSSFSLATSRKCIRLSRSFVFSSLRCSICFSNNEETPSGASWKFNSLTKDCFLRKKKSPSLIIVSKYKPIIEKDSYFLYISKYLIKDKNTVLISKSGKHYLYRSNSMINSNDFKLFGILPKHYED